MHGRSIDIRLKELKRMMREEPEKYKQQLEQDEKDNKELLNHKDRDKQGEI